MEKWLKTPPMGWNSYDYYNTSVTEADVKANADYMAKHLKGFGWEYIVVDIAWYYNEAEDERDQFQYIPFAKVEMDEYSRLYPDPKKFPSSKGGKGFGPLAEYVHNLGLKFGIHIMRGIPRRSAYMRTKIKGTNVTANKIANPNSICFWNPDMYGVNPKAEGAQEYYDSLLELYASWGVDYIKCDDICRMDAASSKDEIRMLHNAIEKCGRKIVLSLSPGPAILDEQDFYHENANMWRITDDFWDRWELLRDMFDRCKKWQPYVKEGGYPDCDMLPLGKLSKGFGAERDTNFTLDEQKTMLTLWCIFRSPLMIGAELTKLDADTMEILTREPLYRMLKEVTSSEEAVREEDYIIWKAESEAKKYYAIFNISDAALTAPLDRIEERIDGALEIWSWKTVKKDESIEIPPHGVILLSMDQDK
ncbi:MAG: glycoside hydrolase family 27 protein [Lachnospiraceae bacterium]|nr:glycoside hydrolase family 27 protein [Lachnospiraceae bacterium]MBR4541244.1 glycoside hydrolase family 27 protein [Lachnospiraceae bacterium]